jgi:hypothetical protein
MDEKQLKEEVEQLLLVRTHLEYFFKKYYSDKTVLSDMDILEKLSAMSKKCMPKIVKRFDYTQDLLERR